MFRLGVANEVDQAPVGLNLARILRDQGFRDLVLAHGPVGELQLVEIGILELRAQSLADFAPRLPLRRTRPIKLLPRAKW
jgi:hypothetical protein